MTRTLGRVEEVTDLECRLDMAVAFAGELSLGWWSGWGAWITDLTHF